VWSVLRSKLTLIDNFGWLDNASIPFSMSRIGAIVSLGIALYLIYSSSRAKAATVEIPVSQCRRELTIIPSVSAAGWR
jgi:transporter family-2 protein